MEKPLSYSNMQFIRDLSTYVSPYQTKFLIGVFFRLTSDIARLYPAYALSQIIPLLGKLSQQETTHTISMYIVFWVFTALYIGIGHNLAKFCGYQVAESAGLDLYKKCLAHVFTLDFSWHELEGSGNKMKRIERGYDGVNQAIRRLFDVLIEVSVNIVGIVLIFSTLETILSICLIFFIVTYFFLGKYLLTKATRQEHIVSAGLEELSGITFQSLNNIQTIKSLAFNTGIVKIVGNHIKNLVKDIHKRTFYYRFQSGTLNTYFYLFEISMISYIVWNITQGNYTVSLLVLFVGLFQKVGESSNELISVTQELVVSKIWVSRAISLLYVTATIENPSKRAAQLPYPSDWKKLRFENIHFTYKKGQALSDVSFEVSRGESVGIVGLSGAGKSTLFKLLLDLYEDYQGHIYLDDKSLKDIDRQSYINHVSVVLQDTELFNMSLRENLTIASLQEPSSAFLDQTIKMAHLEDVVKNLSNGLDTIVGEKGIKLSGGQRQRVGIARALYRQPDILLLDEATSHLDGHSEKQIQEAIAEVKGKFTTIIIAHRLSTISQMDKILVLDKGTIAEIGTFKELLDKNGHFAKMWKMQKL